jgi:predicted DsbA family dithiol-disulfide isomerase
VPGLNATRWTSDLNAQAGSNMLSEAESAAKTAGVESTPTFMVAKTGQTLRAFSPSALTAGAFYAKLNSLTS